jgi:hypothetical protein
MQQMARSLFRTAWRDALRPRGESAPAAPLVSAPEPYIRHRPTEPWELQRIEAALLIPPDEADTLKAVCAHITRHGGDPSSRALAGLVRALYQNADNFNFDSLDCLGPLMRRHAERLISARLWSALTDHEWQQAYAAVASYEFKDNVAKLAAAPKAAPAAPVVPEARLTGAVKTAAELRAPFDPRPSAEAKLTGDSKPTVDPRPLAETRPAADTKPVVDAKPSAEPKPTFEAKPSAEPKVAFEAKPSAEPKPAFDAKPSAEPKHAPEPKPLVELSARRDESRVFAKLQSSAAPVPAIAPGPTPSNAPLPYDAPVRERLPHETFPHADSFNLENIGRHWRVVLWFAMAAVGLVVVTYI